MRVKKIGTIHAIPISKQDLARAGFEVGDSFHLVIDQGMITVTKKTKRKKRVKAPDPVPVKEAPRPKQSGTYDFVLNNL